MARAVIGPELPEDFDEPGRPDPHNLPHRETVTLKGHDGPVFAVRWDRQGKYCLSCGKVSGGLLALGRPAVAVGPFWGRSAAVAATCMGDVTRMRAAQHAGAPPHRRTATSSCGTPPSS